MNALTFNDVTLTATPRPDKQIWIAAAELGKALGYARADNVSRIYDRNADEFTADMSTTVKLTVVRKTGEVIMPVRIFSLRGCHLIAMFAKTPVAKAFRRWVLDLIARQEQQQAAAHIEPAAKALPSRLTFEQRDIMDAVNRALIDIIPDARSGARLSIALHQAVENKFRGSGQCTNARNYHEVIALMARTAADFAAKEAVNDALAAPTAEPTAHQWLAAWQNVNSTVLLGNWVKTAREIHKSASDTLWQISELCDVAHQSDIEQPQVLRSLLKTIQTAAGEAPMMAMADRIKADPKIQELATMNDKDVVAWAKDKGLLI